MSDLDVDLRVLSHEHFPQLTQFEWEAFGRMADKAGDTVVKTVLRSGDADMQRLTAQEFMVHELAEARAARQTTPLLSATPRVTPLKIEVSKYGGDERTPLRRWFCEIDEAISARQISDAQQQVIFAMSMLTGKARSWAFGCKVADRECFPTLEGFKSALQNTFEPPQSEFRLRAEFLSVKQGVMDLHDYGQRVRYLASCVVSVPIDMATQVTTFMTGLRDGPVKTQLFREYPETLEAAFAIALREEFNARQVRERVPRCIPMAQSRWIFKPNVAKDGARALLG